MTAASLPSSLEVEQYIQLEALGTALVNLLQNGDDDLVPNVSVDNILITSTGYEILGEGEMASARPTGDISIDELARRVAPDSGSRMTRPWDALIAARTCTLAARILRLFTPEVVEDAASRLEANADRLLREEVQPASQQHGDA